MKNFFLYGQRVLLDGQVIWSLKIIRKKGFLENFVKRLFLLLKLLNT